MHSRGWFVERKLHIVWPAGRSYDYTLHIILLPVGADLKRDLSPEIKTKKARMILRGLDTRA